MMRKAFGVSLGRVCERDRGNLGKTQVLSEIGEILDGEGDSQIPNMPFQLVLSSASAATSSPLSPAAAEPPSVTTETVPTP